MITPTDEHIFQRVCNHQPVKCLYLKLKATSSWKVKLPSTLDGCCGYPISIRYRKLQPVCESVMFTSGHRWDGPWRVCLSSLEGFLTNNRDPPGEIHHPQIAGLSWLRYLKSHDVSWNLHCSADAMGVSIPSIPPWPTLRPCSEIADAIVATGRRALEEVPLG